jgi:hypothetical protein
MAILYQHRRNDDNSVFYVGRGKTNKRAFSKANRNNHWHNIVNKVGYSVEIIFENLSWEESAIKETELIKSIGRQNIRTGPLVNLTDGGEGMTNFIFSNDAKNKMRLAKIGNKNGSGNKGGKRNPCSPETIKKIGDANRGRIHTEQSRLNMSKAHIGNKLSEETKQKMRGPRGPQKNPRKKSSLNN